jgi:hypothetical protein
LAPTHGSPTTARLPSTANAFTTPKDIRIIAIITPGIHTNTREHIYTPLLVPSSTNPSFANARANPPCLSESATTITGLMHAILIRSPLQSLPTAMNRPTTRRRSAKHGFDDEDAPAAKRPKTEVNGTGKRTNGASKKAAKAGEWELLSGFGGTQNRLGGTLRVFSKL